MIQYGYPQVMLLAWGDDPKEVYTFHAAKSLSGIWLDYALARCVEERFSRVYLDFGTDLRLESIRFELNGQKETWTPRSDESQRSRFLEINELADEPLIVRLQGIVQERFPNGVELMSLDEPNQKRGSARDIGNG